MTASVVFTTFGAPVGQGNIRYNRAGRGYHANGAELDEWRGAIRVAAARTTGYHGFVAVSGRTACALCGTVKDRHGLFLGPVALDAVVALARPRSVTRPYPTSRRHGDWDHHARSIGDALTGLLYADDAQIVDGHVRQVYAGPGAPLPEPGALIRIAEVI